MLQFTARRICCGFSKSYLKRHKPTISASREFLRFTWIFVMRRCTTFETRCAHTHAIFEASGAQKSLFNGKPWEVPHGFLIENHGWHGTPLPCHLTPLLHVPFRPVETNREVYRSGDASWIFARMYKRRFE